MISTTLHPDPDQSAVLDAEWVTATAEKVLAAVEERRSTWQSWHVRAEANATSGPCRFPPPSRSAGRAARRRGAADPIGVAGSARGRHHRTGVLRRADGSSVYTVAGSELFTSTRILAAEQRLVAAAGRTDGRVVDDCVVELALLESAANGNALDVGQAALVRAMCTSGARLQLAIAPAGAGKTTAMRTLARAWTDSGGQVVGLAPSAAAAAQLRDATGAPAETLAKLTWSIHHDDLPDWAERIGRSTLVIIDEAGMADTLSLDTAVGLSLGAAAVSGWSVMINNSPRSAPAGCSATSKPATARSG